MTNEQLIAWLKDSSAIRCVLMEVKVKTGGVEVTRYLSNRGYVSRPTDVPANTIYVPAIAGGVQFTESLSLDGSTSLSSGDIELFNTDGERDNWLDDIWTNRSVKIYIGDVRWSVADFHMIFDGVVAGINTRNRNRINLKLSDKMQLLNTPITENKLGGTSQNKDRLIPLCFGECHNVEPLLSNPAMHEYQVHDGQIEDIIEVRDNGVPVAFTKDLPNGKFKLNQAPVGTITCSVQGDKINTKYSITSADIIYQLVTRYGNAANRLTDADIDMAAVAAFNAASPAPVGLYIKDRMNLLEACNKLASSVGARVTMNRLGKLYLVKLQLPRTDVGTVVTATSIKDRSLSISSMPTIKAGVQLGYCKNWTPQTGLQTGIPAEHINLFSQEWLTVTKTDEAVAAAHKLHTESVMEETLLLTEEDAITEAQRRLNLFGVQRKVVRYESFSELILEALGSTQTLKYGRFGLDEGVAGQVITVVTDWNDLSVTMEVLV